MSKLGHDPWRDAPVWFALDSQSPWLPGVARQCKLLSEDSKEHSFIIVRSDMEESNREDITIISVPIDSFGLEFQHVKKRDKNETNSANVADMTALSFLNEPEMIQCLKQRYINKHIYTNIGPILVAVNPFEQLPKDVYSTSTIERYCGADQSESRKLGPHVFQISNSAYNRMFIDKYDPDKRENQSILVNGESGAGKTESTKQVLRFLASNSASTVASLADVNSTQDVESVISAVNPITESFGNAKTSRNNNSSRFGKFIELEYAADGYIASAHIQTYLLETIRVTSQLKGERNYHIFYELFAGMSDLEREEWNCKALQDFRLLNQSGEYNRYDGESDQSNFERLKDALATIDISTETMNEIFRIVVGILHIGNLSFESSSRIGADAAVFAMSCKDHVSSACGLLGVPESQLVDAITCRSIKVAGNFIQKQLSPDMAMAARDVYAKTTYELLFKNILMEVNRSLTFTDDEESPVSFIGVLDIFGFEFFEHNSFEQLCINYANEKLQDHFNYAIFQSEKEVYEEEGVKWNFTNYPDNSERLELFEHRSTGLFLLCDEQLKIPKPSDEKLVQSFYAKCASYKHFSASKNDKGKMEFVINHFACDVKYKAVGFVDKNRNEIAQEIYDSYSVSSAAFVQRFVHDPSVEHHRSTGRRSFKERDSEVTQKDSHREERSSTVAAKITHTMAVRKKTTSLASQFSKQLYDLIHKIRSTRSHFIRCIKPNNQLLANCFDYEMVMNQLRCGGALGAVQVFRAGFPNRMDFKFFVSRYSAFLVLCGVNALTKDLYDCLLRAREVGSDDLWKLSASMLVDIVSMTIIVLNMVDETELSDDVNILSGLQMGKTQMFLRVPVFELLERLHFRSLTVIAKRLQRRVRTKIALNRNGGVSNSKCIVGEAVMYRSFCRRIVARKCVSATIVLQRRVRVYLAQAARRKTIRAFTLLKAHFRGYKARELVRRLKYSAAVKIQSKYRSFHAKVYFMRMKCISVRLQAMIRMWLAICDLKKKLRLIQTLQCMWRGTQARIRTYVYRQKLKQAQQESQKRAAEAKADFMQNLDEKLKSNPNLLFDMLGASEKIAVLSRQNELLMKNNKELEKENIELRRNLNSIQIQLDAISESVSKNGNHAVAPALKTSIVTPAVNTQATIGELSPVPHAAATAAPSTPSVIDQSFPLPMEFNHMNPKDIVIKAARQGIDVLYKKLGAAKEKRSKVSAELAASEKEGKTLSEAINIRVMKKTEATVELEKLGNFLSEPKNDSSAQLLAVDNQIQILQKRKSALVKLLSNLQADRTNFFEADINGAMTALNEIDIKLAELCTQQQALSKAPIHFSELTDGTEKEGVDKAMQAVQALEAKVSFLTEEIKTLSQQHLLSDLNMRETKLALSECKDDCLALEASLNELQEVVKLLDKPTGVDSFLKTAPPRDLGTMNEVFAEVKEKFSSVRGMMGRFSLGGFRLGSSSGTPEKEQFTVAVGSPDFASTSSTSNSPPFSVQAPKEHSLVQNEKWSPGFIGSVSTWSRSGKRDITFIISVRAVDSGSVAEWTVTRNFADFKNLRQNLLCSPGIDNTFPGDSLYIMFSMSNEAAEVRKDALNTYLLSLCGSEEVMRSGDNARQIKDFLRVDEYMNKKGTY